MIIASSFFSLQVFYINILDVVFRSHNPVDFYSFDILCFICLFYLLDLYEVCKYLFLVNCFFNFVRDWVRLLKNN